MVENDPNPKRKHKREGEHELPDPSGPPLPVHREASRFHLPSRTTLALVVGGTLFAATGGCVVGMPGSGERPRVEWTEPSAGSDQPGGVEEPIRLNQPPTVAGSPDSSKLGGTNGGRR